MPTNIGNSEKPRAEIFRPDLTRLPELSAQRLAFRKKWAGRCAWIMRNFAKVTVHGIENFPLHGPGLIVSNHLGDMDAVLALACAPVQPDGIGKVEIFNWPIVGKLLDRYGVIWIHRGEADRKAIRCALDGLAQGRLVALAPEGRESVTGELEEATGGAAFIALRAGVPVYPIAMTGTENEHMYSSWRRFRRPAVSFSAGPPIHLDDLPRGREGMGPATRRIMQAIAALLPLEYRGVYREGAKKRPEL